MIDCHKPTQIEIIEDKKIWNGLTRRDTWLKCTFWIEKRQAQSFRGFPLKTEAKKLSFRLEYNQLQSCLNKYQEYRNSNRFRNHNRTNIFSIRFIRESNWMRCNISCNTSIGGKFRTAP